jgi:hypothetical protein
VAIDSTWAVTHLQMFVEMINPGRGPLGTTPPLPDSTIVAEALVVEMILDEVTPDWRTVVSASSMHRWGQHREAARHAITELVRAAELRAQSSLEQPAAVSVVAHRVDNTRVLTAL